MTSQSMTIVRSPKASRSIAARRERAIRRWISSVRHLVCLLQPHEEHGYVWRAVTCRTLRSPTLDFYRAENAGHRPQHLQYIKRMCIAHLDQNRSFSMACILTSNGDWAILFRGSSTGTHDRIISH